MSIGRKNDLTFCAVRGDLLQELEQATRNYAQFSNSLAMSMGFLSKADYELRRKEVEQARTKAETVRDELFLHRSQHGC